MKRAETCSCSLCNKLYTYLYHRIVVLDKYIHSNPVYYKYNGDDKPSEDDQDISFILLLCLNYPSNSSDCTSVIHGKQDLPS